MISLKHNGLLVIAVGLIASREFCKVEFRLFPVVICHPDHTGKYEIHRTRFLGHNTDAGVHRSFHFHARTYHRRLRGQ